jgi:hypothetical protein
MINIGGNMVAELKDSSCQTDVSANVVLPMIFTNKNLELKELQIKKLSELAYKPVNPQAEKNLTKD